MRKPRYNDCEDENGEIDWECYEAAMGDYADEMRDDAIEREWDKQAEKDER